MSETVERLAKMADEKAEAFESDAELWRFAQDDTRAQKYIPANEAKARDWREIASRLRAAPEVAVPDGAHWNPHGGADWEAWEKLNADHRRVVAELEEAEAEIERLRTPISREAERALLRRAHKEIGRLGNALNWNPPITQATADLLNAITNQYETGILDRTPEPVTPLSEQETK